MVGTAPASSPGLGAAPAQETPSPLGLLVASRSSGVRMAMRPEMLLANRANPKSQLRPEAHSAVIDWTKETMSNKNQWLPAAVSAVILGESSAGQAKRNDIPLARYFPIRD